MDLANFDMEFSNVNFEEDEEIEASLTGLDPGGFPINNLEGEKCEFESDKQFNEYIAGLDPGGHLNKNSVIVQEDGEGNVPLKKEYANVLNNRLYMANVGVGLDEYLKKT